MTNLSALPPTPAQVRRSTLFRGGRWRLAQVESRALWTTATPTELGELLASAPLRREVEQLLTAAADAIEGVTSLLLFDATGVEVEATVVREADGSFRWRWMSRSSAA
jgi:hypothetical protein